MPLRRAVCALFGSRDLTCSQQKMAFLHNLPYTVAFQKSCSWEAPADLTFLPLIQRHCLSSKLETKLPIHQYIHCGTEFYWLNLSPPRSCTIIIATSTGLCLLLQMPDGSASNGDVVTKRLSVPLYSEWRTWRLRKHWVIIHWISHIGQPHLEARCVCGGQLLTFFYGNKISFSRQIALIMNYLGPER